MAVPRDHSFASDDAAGARVGVGRRRWRWLSFALPPDLMVSALGRHGPTAVDCLSPAIATQLSDQGYAETHVHLGAALTFSHLWAAVLHRISRPDCKEDAFASPGAAFRDGHGLAPWLLRAALARCLLAAYLQSGSSSGFEAYLFSTACRWVTSRVGASYEAFLRAALGELRCGRNLSTGGPPFFSLRHLYSRLSGLERAPTPDHLDEIFAIDPIARTLGYAPGRAEPEITFYRMAVQHLEEAPRDALFADLFWQVVRIRGLFYRHVVQRPMTPGLAWFIRFFDRLREARGVIGDPLRVQSAMRLCGRGAGLRSLEVRTAPDDSEHRILRLFRDCQAAARVEPAGDASGRSVEFGIVLHFIKERCVGAVKQVPPANGLGSHASPTADVNPIPLRYSQFSIAERRRSRALAAALLSSPESLDLCRGVDICSDEQGVPNWVFLPMFDEVREAALEASVTLSRTRGRKPSPPLRATMHVGEDFTHPQTGLRWIADAVRYFRLTEGDRLGHAMALGVDVVDWSRRTGVVAMSREDRLFDVLWEWDWRSRHSTRNGNRRMTLEREIERLSAAVFGSGGLRTELLRLRELLHDGDALRQVGYPYRGNFFFSPVPGRLGLLWSYLADPGLFRRGREIEFVDPSEDGESLAELQSGVRMEVARRGLTVEVNPSSNLLIGDLGSLDRHPLWRLSPPAGGIQSDGVPICIGSDDPITFVTSTREEYQIVHDALLAAGVAPQTALKWIDDVRSNGLRSRFTIANGSTQRPSITS